MNALACGNTQGWALYREAISKLSLDESAALDLISAAYATFREEQDAVGGLLAAATALTTIHIMWSSFHDVDRWLAAMAENIHAETTLSFTPHIVRVDCAMLAAHHFSRTFPQGTLSPSARLKRASELVEREAADFAVNELFTVARALLEFIEAEHLSEHFEPLIIALSRNKPDPRLAPHVLGRALVYVGRCYLRFNLLQTNARYVEKAHLAWEEASALSKQHSNLALAFEVAQAKLFAATTNGEREKLAALVDSMELSIDPARPMPLAEYFAHRTRLALEAEDVDAALSASATAMQALDRAAAPEPQRGQVLMTRVWALALAEQFETADSLLGQFMQCQSGRALDVLECSRHFLRASQLRSSDGPDGNSYLAELQSAVTMAAQLKWPNFLVALPKLAATLCADALNHNIETAFLLASLPQRRLPAPPDAPPLWPWPLRICSLGGFSMKRYGRELAFEGRVQKKPLELLKCLVAAGHRGVDVDLIAEALWPDSEGAQARASLKVTVLRLRKLLEQDEAIEMSDGRIALCSSVVRTDVVELESAIESIESIVHAFGEPPPAAQPLAVLTERLLSTYRGPLFGEDGVNPWLLRARDRLHQRFLRLSGELARHWVQRGDTDRAIKVYERAAEQDPIAEDLHRQLISLFLGQGEMAEAMRVYRRLRQSLSVILGLSPSPRTMALVAPLLR